MDRSVPTLAEVNTDELGRDLIHVDASEWGKLRKSKAGSQDLIDVIGKLGKGRSTGDEFLERALRRYDEEGLYFLSAEFENRWLGETVVIHGSGPSIEQTWPEVLELVAAGAKVCAVNAAYRWIMERGIIPHFAILADPKPWVAEYLDPDPSTIVLVNSGCDDGVIAKFKDRKRTLIWHALNDEGAQEILAQAEAIMAKAKATGKGGYVTEGGSTTTQRALDVFRFLGFRREDFFGVDSSGKRVMADGAETTVMHGHAKPHVIDPQNRPVYVKDPTNDRELAHEFWSNRAMEMQALHWEIVVRDRLRKMRAGTYPPVEYVVHGEGLWPALAAMYGLHHDPTYADRLRAEGYREIPPEPEFDHTDIAFAKLTPETTP